MHPESNLFHAPGLNIIEFAVDWDFKPQQYSFEDSIEQVTSITTWSPIPKVSKWVDDTTVT